MNETESKDVSKCKEASENKKVNVLHWFRKGLRLHDNPALKESLEGADTWRCVYILDPYFAKATQAGIVKWRFLLQCLEDLDASLKKLNSSLFVVRGQPTLVLPRLFAEWSITRLSFEEDPEPFGKIRDMAICNLARENDVEVIIRTSHTLYNLNMVIKRNGGSVPLTFKKFQAYLCKMSLPPRPVRPIEEEDLQGTVTPLDMDHQAQYGVPSLEQLGFNTENLQPVVWSGGETESLIRLDRHLERKAWIANFDKPRMTPQSLMSNPSGLSPYLKFGCLSCRLFFWRLTDLYRTLKNQRDCPMSLHGQILWREFFYLAAIKNAKFDCIKGNPICVQIPWDQNQEALAKWAEGRTGYPWIDAIMTQLREEGWVHHLARHSVACFLTRGDLWISWEEGMKVFGELCLDVDWSINAGSWLWLSCSSFFQHFFQIYCPINFGKRIDPQGNYIRKYLPVFANFPSQYLYEPWAAPMDVQIAARCVVGKDYPCPIVSHEEVSRINLERMKQVYSHLLMKGGPLTKYISRTHKHIIEQIGEKKGRGKSGHHDKAHRHHHKFKESQISNLQYDTDGNLRFYPHKTETTPAVSTPWAYSRPKDSLIVKRALSSNEDSEGDCMHKRLHRN